ncbi:MAG: DUF362 domain-containing protein [Verrucomicrobia bacterium]|nr:DUF362 domain-containing protein [Verrucomicrobiota bacterium]
MKCPRFASRALLGICLSLGVWSHAAAPTLTAPPQLPQARVVVVQDPLAMESFTPRPDIVRGMVDRGILAHTGKPTLAEAWRSVVKTNDVVGLKVFSAPGHTSGTRPAVVGAVVEGLLAAGLPPRSIVIWDRQLVDLRVAGYFELAGRYGVRIASAASAGWDDKVYYESSLLGSLVWGDSEFGKKGDGIGRKSHVSKLVARDLTRHISITPMLNHNLAGVSGHFYSLAFGSVDNTLRFESTSRALAEAVPDVFALPAIYDRLALCITDALICQYQGEHLTRLHYATPLNQLRFSKDPVALDTLSVAEMEAQRQKAGIPSTKFSSDIYKNAGLLLELGVSDPRQIRVEMR